MLRSVRSMMPGAPFPGLRLLALLAAAVVVLAVGLRPQAAQAVDAPPPFGFVGAEVQPVTLDTALALGLDAPGGVVVRDLVPWGPAYGAGLRRGDLLLSWDGVTITGLQHLVGMVQGSRAGDVVPVVRRRLGEQEAVRLTLAPYPDGWSVTTESRAVLPRFGATLLALTPAVREQAELRWGSTGVVVAEVTPGTPAAALGLAIGELLVAADGRRLIDPAEAEAALDSAALLLVEGARGFRVVVPDGAALAAPVMAAGAAWQPLPGGGLMVLDVAHRTPAADAGLRPGDRVTAIGGAGRPDAAAALALALRPADLTVQGLDAEAPRQVALVPDAAATPGESVALVGALQAAVATITPAQRDIFGLRPSARGVVITTVELEGRAVRAGLRPGFVIVAVNQRPVDRPEDVHAELAEAATRQAPQAVLLVEGRQGFRVVGLPLTDEPAAAGDVADPTAAPVLQWGPQGR